MHSPVPNVRNRPAVRLLLTHLPFAQRLAALGNWTLLHVIQALWMVYRADATLPRFSACPHMSCPGANKEYLPTKVRCCRRITEHKHEADPLSPAATPPHLQNTITPCTRRPDYIPSVPACQPRPSVQIAGQPRPTRYCAGNAFELPDGPDSGEWLPCPRTKVIFLSVPHGTLPEGRAWASGEARQRGE